MRVVFPEEIVKDIENGGYKKEEEEREKPEPEPGPDPEPPAVSTDYNDLENKPRINGEELVGDKDFSDLGTRSMTEEEIAKLFA